MAGLCESGLSPALCGSTAIRARAIVVPGTPDIDPRQAKCAPPGYMNFTLQNERIVDLLPNICFYRSRASGTFRCIASPLDELIQANTSLT
jgi:hypothetical protein